MIPVSLTKEEVKKAEFYGIARSSFIDAADAWNGRAGADTAAAYAQMKDAAEFAWTVICNAGEGNWERESQDWQKAAKNAGDMYHAALKDQGTTYAPAGALIDALILKLQEMRKGYRP